MTTDGVLVTNFTRWIPDIGRRFLPTFAVLSLACSAGESNALPVNVLVREYEDSRAEVRRKYDGQEITVRGYTSEAAIMPQPGDDDQGLVLLEEKDRKPVQQVACWFSKDQAEQFSTISSGQFITVKGIFNGEAGTDLRFCKLVKIE